MATNDSTESTNVVQAFARLPLGTVIRTHVDGTNPPKTKRFVIVGYSGDHVITTYFNSSINTVVNYSPELVAQHIHFECEGRTYLSKNCYCDCSQVDVRNSFDLHQATTTNPNIILGHLEESDLDSIMELLKTAPKVRGTYRKRYGFYDYKKEN